MRYKVVDGWTVTGCPYKPKKLVGGFACVMCEHWQSVAHHVSGARAGDPGISEWDVGCSLELLAGREKFSSEIQQNNGSDKGTLSEPIPGTGGVEPVHLFAGDLHGPPHYPGDDKDNDD